jgi:hypothetical protein
VTRKPIIHERRFYWLFADGRREPVRVTERLLAQVRQASYQTQVQAAQRAGEATQAPPDIVPTLPSDIRDIGNRTLSELAHDYGWPSVKRCTTALKAQHPTVYEAARANGKARAYSNLKQGQSA